MIDRKLKIPQMIDVRVRDGRHRQQNVRRARIMHRDRPSTSGTYFA